MKMAEIEKSLLGKNDEETYNNIVFAYETRAKILRPVAKKFNCCVSALCDEELDILSSLRIKWSNKCYPEFVSNQKKYEEKIEILSKLMKQKIDEAFN